MVLMAPPDESKLHAQNDQEKSSTLRDAFLRNGSRDGGDEPHHVTPSEIGRIPPKEERGLNREINLFGPSYLDLALFCRQFAMLTEIGIPVLKSLQMMARRTGHPKLRDAIEDAARGVEGGESIHQAMSRHEVIFTPLIINIIRVGELGGILEDALVRLAEIMESKSKIKRQIVTASAYPLVALCVALMVIILIMVKAVPQFSRVYEQTGSELPEMTQLMINISKVMSSTWWLIVILLVVGFIGLKIWKRTPGGNYFFSLLVLRIPLLRNVAQKIAVARFTRSLGGLISAGIPLVDAISITAETNENAIVREELEIVHDNVEKGERIADTLADSKVIPPMVVDMISIGEETGTLDRMLDKISEIYEAEVDSSMAGLSSIIEPLLIIVLGGVVIFIALSALLPYFNLINAVGG
jgi:type IV pilus assembly protein PilC